MKSDLELTLGKKTLLKTYFKKPILKFETHLCAHIAF